MGLRFVGQPFNEGGQAGQVLTEALRAPWSSNLWIATAWAKRSGLGRIRAAVAEFAAAGGTSEVIVGVDEGGATREGLELCLEMFDATFVYHDPRTRTFHPKIYAVENADRAVVIVGSGSLTKGGLFTNYEAAFVLDASRANAAEWEARSRVRWYRNTRNLNRCWPWRTPTRAFLPVSPVPPLRPAIPPRPAPGVVLPPEVRPPQQAV